MKTLTPFRDKEQNRIFEVDIRRTTIKMIKLDRRLLYFVEGFQISSRVPKSVKRSVSEDFSKGNGGNVSTCQKNTAGITVFPPRTVF